jgi:hypothetical protein
MKQNAGGAAIAAAIIVLVLILGLLGWKAFGSHAGQDSPAVIQSRQAAKKADHKD